MKSESDDISVIKQSISDAETMLDVVTGKDKTEIEDYISDLKIMLEALQETTPAPAKPRATEPEFEIKLPGMKESKSPQPKKAASGKQVPSIDIVEKNIDKKTALPILNYIHVEDGRAMSHTLETTVSCSTDAKDGIYYLKNGKMEFVPDMPVSEFPMDIQLKEDSILTVKLNREQANVLFEAMDFVGEEELRPALTSVYIANRANRLVVNATDAHILFRRVLNPVSIEGEENSSCMITAHTIKLMKAANRDEWTISFHPNKVQKIEERESDGHVKIVSGDLTIISRTIGAKYPNYNGVIPVTNPNFAVFNKNDLLNFIKEWKEYYVTQVKVKHNVDIKWKDEVRSKMIEFGFYPDKIKLHAENIDYAVEKSATIPGKSATDRKSQDTTNTILLMPVMLGDVSAEFSDAIARIGLNSDYIIEAFKHLNDTVYMYFSTENRAVLFSDSQVDMENEQAAYALNNQYAEGGSITKPEAERKYKTPNQLWMMQEADIYPYFHEMNGRIYYNNMLVSGRRDYEGQYMFHAENYKFVPLYFHEWVKHYYYEKVKEAYNEGKYQIAIDNGLMSKEQVDTILSGLDAHPKYRNGGSICPCMKIKMKRIEEEKKFRQGGNTGCADGCYVQGASHENGGVKFYVKSMGETVELEGGEAVIKVTAVNDPKKTHTLDGKKMTNKEILIQINTEHGGNPIL